MPIELSKRDLDELGLFGSIIGHVGDGNFHETILFDGDKERQQIEGCVHKMVDRALEMEGTCTVSRNPRRVAAFHAVANLKDFEG